MSQVTKREDSWIDVPAEASNGFTQGPIQLRPGADESKIRLTVTGAFEQEVDIDALEAGVAAIKAEHAR
jgi:hypothetical protein